MEIQNVLVLVICVLLGLIIWAVTKIYSLKEKLEEISEQCNFTATVNETVSTELTSLKKKAYVRDGKRFIKVK